MATTTMTASTVSNTGLPAGPFDPDGDPALYRAWRDRKLAEYPRGTGTLRVAVRDPRRLSGHELAAIRAICRRANMAILRTPAVGDAGALRAVAGQLGLGEPDRNLLAEEDGLTALRVTPGKAGRGYIPYTDRRLLWHTDGYYNPPARRIRAMALHCLQAAPRGGENRLLDPEILYIHLREAEPALLRALFQPDALTIPANAEAPGVKRPAETGPVFSVDPCSGDLHMRYTARVRSIVWKDDPAVRRAVAWIRDYLDRDSPFIHRVRLAPGEMIVCNNVLHDRSAFQDGPAAQEKRLVIRGRYHRRIAGTGWRLDPDQEVGHAVSQ